MSSTFSSWTRERSANGYAPRTSSCSSSTEISSSAEIATICCARTSSGLRGIVVSSIAPSSMRLRDDGRLEQVGAELGEEAALGDRAELVARTADALQAAGDRLRRLDLDDEVDGAHVDPELERRGRDQARDLPRLEQLLDLGPLLAGDRAVVGAGDLLLRELVQPEGEPLGEAAVVDEDDGGAVLAHEPEQLGVDRRPDRLRRARRRAEQSVAPARRRAPACPRRGRRSRGRAPSRGPRPRARSAGRPPRSGRSPPAGAGSRTAPIRCSGRSTRRSSRSTDEREVRAALRPGDGVHLVQDQRLDRAEVLAARARSAGGRATRAW